MTQGETCYGERVEPGRATGASTWNKSALPALAPAAGSKFLPSVPQFDKRRWKSCCFTEGNQGNEDPASASFADTLSKVIHPPARSAPAHSSPQPAVNNFAELKTKSSEKLLRPRDSSSGRIALDGTRSFVTNP